ncbi:hypothetical protein [Mesorhizobium sp.]|jgi:hypothetical protein|uniref:hypothetical protein n=1 Tax=Mesorhizobium sp. TaxID=1871066 RepID=UPI00356A16B8
MEIPLSVSLDFESAKGLESCQEKRDRDQGARGRSGPGREPSGHTAPDSARNLLGCEECQQNFAFVPDQANEPVWRSGLAASSNVRLAEDDYFDWNVPNGGVSLAHRDTFHVDDEVANVLRLFLKSQQAGGFASANCWIVGCLRKAASGQQAQED